MLLRGLDQFLQPTQGSLSDGMILLKENEFSAAVEDRYWKNDPSYLLQVPMLLKT
jgi:hypothetical protein